MSLSSVESLAISKTRLSKNDRDSVDPGNYKGEFTALISYDIRVGEDYEQIHSASIPWKNLALRLAGSVNEVTLLKIVREIHNDGLSKEFTEEQESRIRPMVNALTEKAVITKKGPVTGNCAIINMERAITAPKTVKSGITRKGNKNISVNNH